MATLFAARGVIAEVVKNLPSLTPHAVKKFEIDPHPPTLLSKLSVFYAVL
jgi:hypothetical protein